MNVLVTQALGSDDDPKRVLTGGREVRDRNLGIPSFRCERGSTTNR